MKERQNVPVTFEGVHVGDADVTEDGFARITLNDSVNGEFLKQTIAAADYLGFSVNGQSVEDRDEEFTNQIIHEVMLEEIDFVCPVCGSSGGKPCTEEIAPGVMKKTAQFHNSRRQLINRGAKNAEARKG